MTVHAFRHTPLQRAAPRLDPAMFHRRTLSRRLTISGPLLALALFLSSGSIVDLQAAESAHPSAQGVQQFEEVIQPFLESYCYDCHGYGSAPGDVALDAFESPESALSNEQLWEKALRQVRSGMMPPNDASSHPSPEEIAKLEGWIKTYSFGIDPENPDPGRVTLRRLNRLEYRNTVRDLLGVDFDTENEFPADDTGHGFDNIADVLTISPLLMEKYISAARTVVNKSVPSEPWVYQKRTLPGARFHDVGTEPGDRQWGRRSLSYYEPAHVEAVWEVPQDGDYRFVIELVAADRYVDGVPDFNRCGVVIKMNGEELLTKEFQREGGREFKFEFERTFKAGEQKKFELELTPLSEEEQTRSLRLDIAQVEFTGPLDLQKRIRPEGYAKWFPRDSVPESAEERREYARSIIEPFANRAYRRPVSQEKISRLLDLAERVYSTEGTPFEAGVAEAMVAVLASPSFLFREEFVQPGDGGEAFPLVDEYSLASRLSYFLWSTMPDEELIKLAKEGQLRANLDSQIDRMLADPKSEQFISNFPGQWLQARDVESVVINSRAVVAGDMPPDPEAERRMQRFRDLRRKNPDELTEEEQAELREIRQEFFASFRRGPRGPQFNDSVRRAMRRETEMLFEHILRNDRSLLELLDSNYTFLNGELARYYSIDGVDGREMQYVELPADSPRGGILTQGTVLTVTSNPDRTSPVKRGLFILENILGVPPAPPPPNIPALEEPGRGQRAQRTLRETLELHRADPTCSSCHNRMDPLGLAFENFNAMGIWRDQERAGKINASGVLVTGEEFESVNELKKILVTTRKTDFYRCLTEKMLTYALGRGLEPADTYTIDELVAQLEETNGSSQTLLRGIIDSAPFQRRRQSPAGEALGQAEPAREIPADDQQNEIGSSRLTASD